MSDILRSGTIICRGPIERPADVDMTYTALLIRPSIETPHWRGYVIAAFLIVGIIISHIIPAWYIWRERKKQIPEGRCYLLDVGLNHRRWFRI